MKLSEYDLHLSYYSLKQSPVLLCSFGTYVYFSHMKLHSYGCTPGGLVE